MGVSLTNPKQAAIPFFRHTKILHMLVSMGSTALVLPRYGGLNSVRGINEVLKKKKMARCIILYNARVKILNKSASFTTKCIMVRESQKMFD